jgi:hypothetical protein
MYPQSILAALAFSKFLMRARLAVKELTENGKTQQIADVLGVGKQKTRPSRALMPQMGQTPKRNIKKRREAKEKSYF